MRRFPCSFGRLTTRNARASVSIFSLRSLCRMDSTMSERVLDITATPAPGQNIFHEDKEYTTIKEGLAYILVPASSAPVSQNVPKSSKSGAENEAQSVFYNPIQQFNRDLSVLAIKAYGEQIMERKVKYAESQRSKLAAKRQEKKDKKRKREGEIENHASRKAGKLDDGSTDKKMAFNGDAEKEVKVEEQEDLAVVAATGESTDGQQITKEEVPQDAEVAIAVEPQPNLDQANENPQARPQQNDSTLKLPPSPPFSILDALSATGLRALRYSHEIPFTTSVTANDLLPEATKTIQMNVKHNKLDHKIKALTGNAMSHMYSLIGDNFKDDKGKQVLPSKKYDVIDLDPYGTAAPFLDAAVQSVRDDGGLLCVTCTDAGVWASNGYPEKAYSLYGGIPIKGLHSHEGGLRLILHSIAASAARYGLAVEPLLSLSIDFYARVFVRIHKSPADVKFLAGKTMVVYNCDTGCNAWTTQMVGRNKLAQNKSGKGYFWKHVFSQAPNVGENCEHCGMKTHMAGPMWAGPLHSPQFVQKILDDLPNVSKETYQTTTRIQGMLTLALDEMMPAAEDPNSPTLSSKTGRYDPAEIDPVPFLFLPGVLSKVVHCITPDEPSFKGALRHAGYRVTRSHTKAGSIKTDAPWDVIWDIMREWVKQKSPVKEGALRKGTAGYKIMGLDAVEEVAGGEGEKKEVETAAIDDKPKKLEVVFDQALGKEKRNRDIVRYPANPRENWGPMNRAKGKA